MPEKTHKPSRRAAAEQRSDPGDLLAETLLLELQAF
jgi:hypothetical protein